MRTAILLLILAAMTPRIAGQEAEPYYRDIYPDTWVAVDALGRAMPGVDEAGLPKTDRRRVTGIFYITWHDDGKANMKAPYVADVSKILAQDSSARLDARHPLWTESSYHWGEPEDGYFLSRDEYVIRKDISMLSDAGVDVLVMDVTNAVRYWDEWESLFGVMQQMRSEGNRTPYFCFWAFNGPVITVVQELYEKYYRQNRYRDLWFLWDGKPLLLYNARPEFDANGGGVKNPNPNYDPDAKVNTRNPRYGNPDYTEENYGDYTAEVKAFFSLRNMWWGYYEWEGERYVGTEDNWSFGYSMADPKVKAMPPDSLLSLHRGVREQAAVTPAQHPVTMSGENMGVGKSWSRDGGEPPLNAFDMPAPTYVPWLGKTVEHPEGYGIYFQERWDEAIASDPQFLYMNDWNEWTAGKYDWAIPWLGREKDRANPFCFVDQYNAEFNRTIQPMKGGYVDNYYMQMAQNIRRYKGVRPIPEYAGFHRIDIDGCFDDWTSVETHFFDTKNDVVHRDFNGYGGLRYVNTSGRNDILTAKVAADRTHVYFYVETDSALTSHAGDRWMLLLIDADHDPATGWHGYDYLLNQSVVNDRQTTLMRYAGKGKWKTAARVAYRYAGERLEVAIPRKTLGLSSGEIVMDFKWSDHPADMDDILSLCVNGDTAPNRRFNYRFIWKQ
jgi:hypothetical protein